MYFSTTADEKPYLRDFFAWLTYRGINESDVTSMSIDRRKEIFLKWKWGSSEPGSNQEAESTRGLAISTLKKQGLDHISDPYELAYWKTALAFDEKCNKIMERIGIIRSEAHTDPVVREVVRNVSGTITGGYRREYSHA